MYSILKSTLPVPLHGYPYRILPESTSERRCAALHTPSLPLLYHFFSKVKVFCCIIENYYNFPETSSCFCRAVTLGWSSGFILQKYVRSSGRETHFSGENSVRTGIQQRGVCTAGIRCQLFSSESSSSEDILRMPASSQPDIVSNNAAFFS